VCSIQFAIIAQLCGAPADADIAMVIALSSSNWRGRQSSTRRLGRRRAFGSAFDLFNNAGLAGPPRGADGRKPLPISPAGTKQIPNRGENECRQSSRLDLPARLLGRADEVIE